MYTVVFHNYHGQHKYWIDFFKKNIPTPYYLFYNIVSDSLHNMHVQPNDLTARFAVGNSGNKLVVRQSTNVGRDIGGKLVLMDALLHLNIDSEYLLVLHDKKSPQSVTDPTWGSRILKIAEKSEIEKAVQVFMNDPGVGLVAVKNTVVNEKPFDDADFISVNASLLKALVDKYQLQSDNYQFVAGSMFMARLKPFIDFFSTYRPLEIRKTLERGNVMDVFTATQTHSWERMLSWIVSSKGFALKEI